MSIGTQIARRLNHLENTHRKTAVTDRIYDIAHAINCAVFDHKYVKGTCERCGVPKRSKRFPNPVDVVLGKP